MPFDQNDIPDKEEVIPRSVASGTGSNVELVQEAVTDAGEVHIYLANTGPDEDVHLRKDMCYIWKNVRDGKGLIYVMDGGAQRWVFPEHILFIETHDEI